MIELYPDSKFQKMVVYCTSEKVGQVLYFGDIGSIDLDFDFTDMIKIVHSKTIKKIKLYGVKDFQYDYLYQEFQEFGLGTKILAILGTKKISFVVSPFRNNIT